MLLLESNQLPIDLQSIALPRELNSLGFISVLKGVNMLLRVSNQNESILDFISMLISGGGLESNQRGYFITKNC